MIQKVLATKPDNPRSSTHPNLFASQRLNNGSVFRTFVGFIGPDGLKSRNAPTVSRTFIFACGSAAERERLRVALLNSPASALGLPRLHVGYVKI